MNQADLDRQQKYSEQVKKASPNSPIFKDCALAFVFGGLFCILGQALNDFAVNVLNLTKDNSSVFTAIVLVFIGATLTGLGLYAKIGKYAGAGSVVPITGFANSIVSPAMEFRREGLVLGVGAKMFSIAGPVLVYGIGTSIIVGVLKYAFFK